MEFYVICARHDACGLVSIPNGMEFYDKIQIDLSLDAMFQFPTGWNSTLSARGTTLAASFQFPTGWNPAKI